MTKKQRSNDIARLESSSFLDEVVDAHHTMILFRIMQIAIGLGLLGERQYSAQYVAGELDRKCEPVEKDDNDISYLEYKLSIADQWYEELRPTVAKRIKS